MLLVFGTTIRLGAAAKREREARECVHGDAPKKCVWQEENAQQPFIKNEETQRGEGSRTNKQTYRPTCLCPQERGDEGGKGKRKAKQNKTKQTESRHSGGGLVIVVLAVFRFLLLFYFVSWSTVCFSTRTPPPSSMMR
jgi:hypothetical protein